MARQGTCQRQRVSKIRGGTFHVFLFGEESGGFREEDSMINLCYVHISNYENERLEPSPCCWQDTHVINGLME